MALFKESTRMKPELLPNRWVVFCVIQATLCSEALSQAGGIIKI